jgi:hypothetical protein
MGLLFTIAAGPCQRRPQAESQNQSHIATDCQTVSKSWCRAPSGVHDQIFITVSRLRSCFCGAPSLTRGRVCLLYMLQALASAVLLGSESLGTPDHILLSQIRDVSFRRLLRLAGSRWRYSTPPPHGLLQNSRSISLLYNAGTDRRRKQLSISYPRKRLFTEPLPSSGWFLDHDWRLVCRRMNQWALELAWSVLIGQRLIQCGWLTQMYSEQKICCRSLQCNLNCIIDNATLHVILTFWELDQYIETKDCYLFVIPSPQQAGWTHHTFVPSYNVFRLIEPWSRFWLLFYIHLYSSASFPAVASVLHIGLLVFHLMNTNECKKIR